MSDTVLPANGAPQRDPRAVYIMRHGATRLNNQTDLSVDRERGWSDVPLTEEGREEARKAGARLKVENIAALVSSDLNRAKETAQIIGSILGLKPENSFKLRPWNLGNLTGKATKEARPQIELYARQKPDEAVPDGESFNTFRKRAFEGLREALARHPSKLLIVAHHRFERLIGGWDELGQPKDFSVDVEEFLDKGAPPGAIMVLRLNDSGMMGAGMPVGSAPAADETAQGAGEKLSHAAVHYGLAKGNDKCANCKSYRGKNDCIKVVPPIYPGGWCEVGHSKIDGHAYKAEAAEPAYEERSETSAQEAAEQGMSNVGGGNALAHGRAIAGAKALHAVGHISANERDKHVQASTAAIAKQKPAPRRPFGSFAPQ